MILSGQRILARCRESGNTQDDAGNNPGTDIPGSGKTAGTGRDLVITPFSDECLQPASYDLRVAHDVVLSRGLVTLIPSLEWVGIPQDLAATLRCRSSFGRKGVLIAAGFVDPGFRGQLTLCLLNMGPDDISIRRNDRVVQMILHEVMDNDRLYGGRYQDSEGVVHAR
jgi:dCTP deaminase